MTDIKAVAEPWKDPLGNVWCVRVATGGPHPGCWCELWGLDRERWISLGYREPYTLNAELLCGLGYTLPLVPTPKKVAGVVQVEGCRAEYAVAHGERYFRPHSGEGWEESLVMDKKEYILAAARAYELAGEVLPD